MSEKVMAPRYEVQMYRDGAESGEEPGWYRLWPADNLEPSRLGKMLDWLASEFPGATMRLVEWTPRVVEWSKGDE